LARQHDMDYDAVKAKGSFGLFVDTEAQPADAKLAAGSLYAVFHNNNFSDRVRAAIIYVALSRISLYKYPFYKARQKAEQDAVQSMYSSQIKF